MSQLFNYHYQQPSCYFSHTTCVVLQPLVQYELCNVNLRHAANVYAQLLYVCMLPYNGKFARKKMFVIFTFYQPFANIFQQIFQFLHESRFKILSFATIFSLTSFQFSNRKCFLPLEFPSIRYSLCQYIHTYNYSLVLPTEDSSILLLIKRIIVVVRGSHHDKSTTRLYLGLLCWGEPRLLFTVVMALDEFEAPHEIDITLSMLMYQQNLPLQKALKACTT